MSVIDSRLMAISTWLAAKTSMPRGVLVPISGGSDSALCFWLCVQALGRERVVAAYCGAADTLRCRDWFEALGTVRYLESPEGSDEHQEIQRWALMLAQARTVRGWLVGSRNRTEQVLGTYSLASRLATCMPLCRLWKSELMALCTQVGVPAEILQSSLRADPACGRPKELADISFAAVDLFLQVQLGEQPESALQMLSVPQVEYLKDVYRRNRFKQELPLMP